MEIVKKGKSGNPKANMDERNGMGL